jgi:hypothetical protein
MSVPKSVIKFDKDGVKYESSVDKAQYTIHELTRAALRDVGKFITKSFRKEYYGIFKRKKGNIGKYTQYWVRSKQDTPDLQVGLKPNAFYGGFQELGSSKTTKLGLLSKTVQDNISEIIKIESQYLSALEDEAKALELINEEEYEGGADE